MNVFKKIYCRAFQFAFKCALPVLPYKNPEIIQKVGDIAGVIIKNGRKKPLVITDATLQKLGLTEAVYNALKAEGIACSVYDGVVANPTTDNVAEALAIYEREGCDCLVAFGGGSPMDCAKGVGALVARPKKSLNDLKGILKVKKKIPLLIAVPTTAGTGSETTLACVIVDSKTRHKYAINDFPLIPRYAVLDEQTILSLPPFVAATTGMDALTHAVEAFIGKSGNKSTRSDALRAIKLIFENLEEFYAERSREAARNMLTASHLAGRAFSKAYVGYVHAIAHSLGGKYDVPHGLANAVILPVVLREYGKRIHKKLFKIAVACKLADKNTPREVAAEMVIERIEGLNEKFAIPKKLNGIKRADIPELAAHAEKEANPLYPVPVLWDKRKIESIYEKTGEIDEDKNFD